MAPIQVLPKALQEKIAAGEVVERPASVVKELVENALDAGATRITIEIEKGGIEKIRVVDNGVGMSPEELPLAFKRHATSKLRDEEGLFAIKTLGFRGEALPSIAAVARVEVWSTQRGAVSGHWVHLQGGSLIETSPVGFPCGTAVEVTDLFYNTPARKKFLRSSSAEFSHIISVLKRLALAQNGVGIHLRHNRRTVWDLPASYRFEQKIQVLIAPEEPIDWIPIDAKCDTIRMEGFLAEHPFSLPTPREIYLFVNRRPVRDRIIQKAFLEACQEVWPAGRYPAALLHIDIDPSLVDVNVHPTKSEVRFLKPNDVYQTVWRGVRARLSPRSVHLSQPNQDFLREIPRMERVAEPAFGAWERSSDRSSSGVSAGELQRTSPSLDFPLTSPKGYYSSLSVVGRIRGTYIVCEDPAGMVVIDQHAAHERVIFMRLKEAFEKGNIEREPLLVPEVIDLTPEEADLLREEGSLFEEIGFEIEPFGGRSFVIKTRPRFLLEIDVTDLMGELMERLKLGLEPPKGGERIDPLLATVACHSAIRAHDRLRGETIRSLLEQMDQTDLAYACPHGRPAVHKVPFSEIEGWFQRHS